VDLGQIVRRNRARIVVILLVSAVNYWLIVSFLAWLATLPVEVSLPRWAPLGFGAVIAAGVITFKLHSISARTLRALGAIPIHPEDFPVVTNLLEALAIAVGTPPVRAAYLRDPAPNAMAVGTSPRNTTIVLTKGLLEKCTRSELEAVLAVEMCSVRRFDTALQTVALAATSGVRDIHQYFRESWANPGTWGWIAITWPSLAIAEVVRAVEFRNSDFGADAMALTMTRNPEGLDRALKRLDEDPSTVTSLDQATAPLWFEPVPHRDPERTREFQRFAMTASLAERRARLPHVRA
jgi:heat shock protein HtpX